MVLTKASSSKLHDKHDVLKNLFCELNYKYTYFKVHTSFKIKKCSKYYYKTCSKHGFKYYVYSNNSNYNIKRF